jgi:hypothetical protein
VVVQRGRTAHCQAPLERKVAVQYAENTSCGRKLRLFLFIFFSRNLLYFKNAQSAQLNFLLTIRNVNRLSARHNVRTYTSIQTGLWFQATEQYGMWSSWVVNQWGLAVVTNTSDERIEVQFYLEDGSYIFRNTENRLKYYESQSRRPHNSHFRRRKNPKFQN